MSLLKVFTGVYDPLDGEVIESITFEQAEKVKFKHPYMFSDKSNIGYKEGQYGRFIVDKDNIVLQYRGDTYEEKDLLLKRKIKEQL